MSRYIDRDKLCDFARNHKDGTIGGNDIMRFPTAEIEVSTSRYIDANAAIKSFKDSHIEGNCYTPNFIVEFVEKQPTANVEEVVRCKDCKYCEKFVDDFGVEKYFCVYFCGSQETEQNGYCYRGRKQ